MVVPGALGIIHRPDVVSIEAKDSDLPAHHAHQLFAHLRRENKLTIWKFRYALTVLIPYPEESITQLLKFVEMARRPIVRFKFLKIYRIHGSL